MKYFISHFDSHIQISFIFKAFLMHNGTHINITEKNQEAVLYWFCEYAYFAIDKYDIKNFKISPLKFHPENFNVSFEIKNKEEIEESDLEPFSKEYGTSKKKIVSTISLFDITEIIKLILKPDPKKEFPLVLDSILYYPVGYVPEY